MFLEQPVGDHKDLVHIILVNNVHKYYQVFLRLVVAQTLEDANNKRLLRKMLSYSRLDLQELVRLD